MYRSVGFRFTGEIAKPHSTRLLHMIEALGIRSTDREAS
jgi:hypothetical protein